jgi:hypothetical protein
MFFKKAIKSIEFPKNLKHIGHAVFYGAVFDNQNFIIPDSVTSYGINTFNFSNLKSITGNNIIYIYGDIV